MQRPDDSRVAASFPVLDSMRAFAAIGVLGTHAAFWAGDYSQPVWGTALARLDVGVAVFFVLSGFLLSLPWFERARAGLPAPSTGRYLWKRALRLVPVYMLTAVAALAFLPGNENAGPQDWMTTLLLADIYVDDQLPDGLTQMWSLSTEVAFYLVLPALMWLVFPRRASGRRGDRLGAVVLAMVVTTVVWLLDLSVRLDNGDTMIRLWLPSYLTWFTVGLVLSRTVSRRAQGSRGRLTTLVTEVARSPGLCWLSAAALFVIAATPVAGPADLTPPTLGAALAKNILYAAIAGLLVIPGVFAPAEGRFARALSHPALRHLGHLSYGIFCVHLLLLELITDWRDMPLFAGRGVELFVITLVASIAVSEVLYRVIERPSQRLRHLRAPWAAPAASHIPNDTVTSSWGATSAPAHPSSEPSGRSQ